MIPKTSTDEEVEIKGFIVRPNESEKVPTDYSSSSKAPVFPFFPTPSSTKPSTRYPFRPSTPAPTAPHPKPRPKTTILPEEGRGDGEESTIYPGIEPLKQKSTLKSSFTIPFTTTQKYGPATEEPVLNYCRLLNCDFNGWPYYHKYKRHANINILVIMLANYNVFY